MTLLESKDRVLAWRSETGASSSPDMNELTSAPLSEVQVPVNTPAMSASCVGHPHLVCELDGQQEYGLSSDCVIPVPKGTWIRFQIASGGHWYGHGFAHRQPYPLNLEAMVNQRFAVNNIQSPIWMCSAGFALLANTVEVLDVRFNENKSGWLEVRCQEAAFSMQVFQGSTLPEAHRKLMRFLQWPSPAPEKSLLGDSIFCTWTQYPRAITQKRVLGMANEIREHGFPCSVLTIDDRWESMFGELSFSKDFPNPKEMVDELHRLGFRVLLWVTPFINREAETFGLLAKNGWLAKSKEGAESSLFHWWGGTAGLVDITNPEAREWFRRQLLRLKNEIGIDGFKIDGGDAKYQPDIAKTVWHNYAGPSGYVERLLELFEEVAPGMCESRTGWLSQGRNILWREGGKDSHWGVDNGLKAMVHLGLHLALLGYDLLIPDMIPGRIQTMVSSLPLPTDELFVRWTEASALMPVVQFSYFPWNYSAVTSGITQRYAVLHKALEDYLVSQATERVAPLLRPLWYDAQQYAELYSVSDEFLLGSDILAAPVMEEGAVDRDVVLPPGKWRDAWTGDVYGGTVLRHQAPCPGIPVFIREERSDLFELLNPILRTISRGVIASGETSASYTCGLDRDINVTG